MGGNKGGKYETNVYCCGFHIRCSDTIATVWWLRQVADSQRGEGRVVVVPTGFEPVFKDDYDFALNFHVLR